MSFSQRQHTARAISWRSSVIVPDRLAECRRVDKSAVEPCRVHDSKGHSTAKILERLKAIEVERGVGILASPNGSRSPPEITWWGSTAPTTRRSLIGRAGRTQYQVQETPLSTDVVYRAALAITRAPGTMADRVMAGMEAADENGGDKRCNCGNNPVTSAPCDHRTAHVAYITIANKDDLFGETHNDGKYFAYITASDADVGAGESANPVKTLRMRYEAWKRAGSNRSAPRPADVSTRASPARIPSTCGWLT